MNMFNFLGGLEKDVLRRRLHYLLLASERRPIREDYFWMEGAWHEVREKRSREKG